MSKVYLANEETQSEIRDLLQEINEKVTTKKTKEDKLEVENNPEHTTVYAQAGATSTVLTSGTEYNAFHLFEYNRGDRIIPTYIDMESFSTPGDTRAIFTIGRQIILNGETSSVSTNVDETTYDQENNITTVFCSHTVVMPDIKQVEVAVYDQSTPLDVVRVKDLKDNNDKIYEEIYKHNHTAGLGQKIVSESLANQAVTSTKIASEAVTTEKIANKAVTISKIDPKVLSSGDLGVRSTLWKGHISQGFDLSISPDTHKPVISPGRLYSNKKYFDKYESTELDLGNFKGLIYAKATPDNGDITFEAKPFELPYDYTPQEDKIAEYDYKLDETNDPLQVIRDLTGNGQDLTPVGSGVSKMKVASPMSWNVPDPGMDGDIYWKTGDYAFKGFEAEKPLSIMHVFIPRTKNGDIMPLNIYPMSVGYGYNFYFEYNSYNPYSDSYYGRFYLNRWSSSSYGDATVYPCIIFRNKPTMLVLENDGHFIKFFVNGRLAFQSIWNSALPAASAGTLYINSYYSGYTGWDIPIYTCIRQGTWSETEIAEMANIMGIPNEHIGYTPELPALLGSEGSTYKNEYHAYDLAEEVGNSSLDKNRENPIDVILNNAQRVYTNFKNGLPSIRLNASGNLAFGNHRIGNEFSFFTLITVHDNGYIMANHPDYGVIFYAYSNYLRLWLNGWNDSSFRIPYDTPIVVGFTIKDNIATMYSDTTVPEIFRFSLYDGLHNDNPMYAGQDTTNGARIDAIYHDIVMADKAFTESEVQEIFKSFKKRSYRYISDDLGLSRDTAIIGMVNTDEEGNAIQLETYPRWGRRKNPYLSNKYFLGWKHVIGKSGYNQVPNLLGSSRVRVNLYAQLQKNDGIVKTIPTEMLTTAPDQSICEVNATSDYIQFNAPNAYPGKYLMGNYNGRYGNYGYAWIGFELEPIADEDNINNLDF